MCFVICKIVLRSCWSKWETLAIDIEKIKQLRPDGGHGSPLQYSCLENPHGQKSLVGYSPWGHKEADTEKQLITAQAVKNWVINAIDYQKL